MRVSKPRELLPLFGFGGAYDWQKEAMDEVLSVYSRYGLCTMNESGKTSMAIPMIGLVAMSVFPGCQVVSTAGVERQIKQQLWPIVKAKCERFGGWVVTKDRVQAPQVDRDVPASEWVTFVPKDAMLAEGYHGRMYDLGGGRKKYTPLLMIIDEAKSIERDVFEAWLRCNPDFWFTTSTPGEESGPFYDVMMDRTEYWKSRFIERGECPHFLGEKYVRTFDYLVRKYGIDSPFVQSMLFGKFFRAKERYVFDEFGRVQEAMGGTHAVWGFGRACAMEFSAGGDEQVIGVREGNCVLEIKAFHERDTDRLCSLFAEVFRRWDLRPSQLIGDNGGLGLAIMDNLEARGWRGMRRYMGNEPARDQSFFVDQYAEDHWLVRTLVNDGAIVLPADDTLKEQMRVRKYEIRNEDNNRIKVERKKEVRKRGEDSPDRLDMLVMLFRDLEYKGTGRSVGLGAAHAQKSLLRTESEVPSCSSGREDRGMWGMRCDE